MTNMNMFFLGFVGSWALEIVKVNQAAGRGCFRLPRCWSDWRFYLFRFLLACVAGLLVLAYHVQNPVLALNIGAAAPLVIEGFSRKKPPS